MENEGNAEKKDGMQAMGWKCKESGWWMEIRKIHGIRVVMQRIKIET